MRMCVIIPAAGQGRRYGSIDKLGVDLGGRPLLNRTVEIFTKREEVVSIIVAGPPDDMPEFRDRYGATLGFHGVKLVEGGRHERWETVRNALQAVPDDCTHIAVHDAGRPAATAVLLDRVFQAARTLNAVIPVVAVTATLKNLEDEALEVSDDDAIADSILGDEGKTRVKARKVKRTIDRRGVYEVQTPQVFQADLLRRAYAQNDLAAKAVTDDASLVELLGEPVYGVDGDPRNIKLTTPAELPLLRAILNVQPPAERPAHMRF